jgi:hypothetical protein
MRLKKILTTLFTAVTILLTTLQAEESYSIEWIKLLGGANNDQGKSIVVDSSSSIYVTGHTYSQELDGNISSGGYDVFITKYSSSGDKLWTKLLGESGSEFVTSIAVDSSDNIYIAGYTESDLDGNISSGGYDAFIAKYSSNGDKLWTKLLGGNEMEHWASLFIDSSSNIYVTGGTESNLDGNTNSGEIDIFIAKYSSSAEKEWTRVLGGAGAEQARAIVADSSGNAYITGYTFSNLDGNISSGLADIFVAKYSSSGDKLWVELLGSSESDAGTSIAIDSSDNIYIVGYTYGDLDGNANSGSLDTFIAKYSSSGERLWTRLLGGAANDGSWSIEVDSMDNPYISGYTNSILTAGEHDIFITKYSSSGDKMWTKIFGGVYNDGAYSTTEDSKKNIYVTGDTASNLDGNINSGEYDVFIAKLHPVLSEYSSEAIDISGNYIKDTTLVEYCSSNIFNCGIDEINETYINNLGSGWRLLGSSIEISDMSIFSSASFVWSYDKESSSWSIYSAYTLPSSVTESFNLLSIIPINQGFWVYK